MQITKVKVKDLYGLHHYEITFDEDACIKIIHAPNGYGKTTLLKLIDSVMYYRLEEISLIPFTCFEITFGKEIRVEVFKRYEENAQHVEYVIFEKEQEKSYKCFLSDHKGDLLMEKQLLEKLEVIRLQMPIHFIGANRLLQDENKESIPSVLRYAKELSEKMKNVLAKYAKLSEELDRNFPKRLMECMNKFDENNIDYIKIISQIKEIEKKKEKS